MSGFGAAAAAAAKALSETFGEASRRRGPKTLRSHTNCTPHRTVRLSHDVITFWTRLVFFVLFFSRSLAQNCAITNYIDRRSRCLEFSSSQRGPDNTSLSPTRSLSFQTISICAMSSQQFHAIGDDCIVYTAAFKTITTCLGRNLSDSGHDRQFSWG